MTHLILLLYLVAGLSGIGSMIYLVTKYGRKSSFIRAYMDVHFSYTLLMLAALVVLYLRVNVIRSSTVMSVFVAVILLGQGGLIRAISRLGLNAGEGGRKNRSRVIWNILPFVYAVLAVMHFLLRNSSFVLYPVIIGVTLFIIITLHFSRMNAGKDEGHTGEDKRVWLIFFIFTFLIITAEITLKIFTGFLGEYTLNIPAIFLYWNYLSLSQLRKRFEDSGDSAEISPESIDRWQLTSREVEISRAILRGDSNKEIASRLNISSSTVKNHIYNIYRKTGAGSRVDLLNLLR